MSEAAGVGKTNMYVYEVVQYMAVMWMILMMRV